MSKRVGRTNQEKANRDQIERVKRLAIIAMFSDDELMQKLVLKGGNALDLIHGLIMRSSLDLDFSMEGDFDRNNLEAVQNKIRSLLETTFGEAGYQVLDFRFEERPPEVSPEMEGFWGGYRIRFKVIERPEADRLKDLESMRRHAVVIGPNQERTLMIEISKNEYCEAKVERELDSYTIYVYPLALIALEKLRAICQQAPEYRTRVKKHFSPRARDFFDICTILENSEIDLASPPNLQLLRVVFAAKRVPLHLLGQIEPSRNDHRADYVSLQDTLYPNVRLKSFDDYFDKVANLGHCLLHALGEI